MTGFNLFKPNGISHYYQFGESIFSLGLVYGIFIFIEILIANSGDPVKMLGFVASDLGLYSLPMSHKKDARHIWVKHLTLLKIPFINLTFGWHIKGPQN